MRIVRIALTLTLLAAGPVLVPAVAAARPGATQTCDGQPATLVGTPGEDLSGTTGPDVIVTNGATSVYAAEGADLVCMTGGDTAVTLDGFDETFASGTWAQDRVIGTGGDDVVLSGNFDDLSELRYDTENLDDVALGSGDSTLIMVGAPVGSIDGGAGRDRLVLQAADRRSPTPSPSTRRVARSASPGTDRRP